MKDPSHCHWKQSFHSESKSLCDTGFKLKSWPCSLKSRILERHFTSLSLTLPNTMQFVFKNSIPAVKIRLILIECWENLKLFHFKKLLKNNQKICGNIFLRGLILLNWDLTLRNCNLWYLPVQLEIIIFTSPCSILDSIQLQDYPNGNGLFLYYMALHLNKHGVTHTVDGTFCCRLLCNYFSWIASHDMCPI